MEKGPDGHRLVDHRGSGGFRCGDACKRGLESRRRDQCAAPLRRRLRRRALANAAITIVDRAAAVIALRFATGAALACLSPGSQIAAGWLRERRGTALGIVVAALTIGSAVPHLHTWGATTVSWRALMWVSSAFALAAGALVLLAVADDPYFTATAPLDPPYPAIGT